jgi:hypothetical protein
MVRRLLPSAAALLAAAACIQIPGPARAEPPGVSYIFPAGAQRGSSVEARVGGFYFHGNAGFHFLHGPLSAQPRLTQMETLFFNGPLILKPASQNREDYPKDHAARIQVPADAPLGAHLWRCSTSQGVTSSLKFVVGDLPELLESEIEGPENPTRVQHPVTINGRIFPREDSDRWSFTVQQGATVTCKLAARSLGSPLLGILEVLSPRGEKARDVQHAISPEGDPVVWFTAAQSGVHTVQIRDAGFGGGQQYVYRLSIFEGRPVESVFPLGGRANEPTEFSVHPRGSGAPELRRVRLPAAPGIHVLPAPAVEKGGKSGRLSEPLTVHVSDLPEVVRPFGAKPQPAAAHAQPLPCVFNGCIATPGESHDWKVALEAGTCLQLEVLAAALGSRLDSVVTLLGPDGREVAKNDDAAEGQPDSALSFAVAKAGEYTVRIQDRFTRRCGPAFGYRLKATTAGPTDFQLRLAADFYNAVRSDVAPPDENASKPGPKPPGLKLELTSSVGATDPIALEVEGLPEGATFEPKTIPAKAKSVELRFTIPPKTPVSVHPIRIKGTMGEGAGAVTRTATVTEARLAMHGVTEHPVQLAVVPRVPFQFFGDYLVNNDQPAGTFLARTYRLERGGFSGPLTAALSDKQIRCLQRAQGKPCVIPPGASSFDFTIQYPVEVQLGWTSRAQVMVYGNFKDFDGSEHILTYTSSAPDEQIISVVTSTLLSLSTPQGSVLASGNVLSIPVTVHRHDSLGATPVRVELRTPAHVRGIHADPVLVPSHQREAVLSIRLSPDAGPFNAPLEIFAQTDTSAGATFHSGATRLELVRPSAETKSAANR